MPLIYRYGRLAWLWRAMIAGAVVGGGVLVALSIPLRAPLFVLIALPLLLPALYCGWVVATSVQVEGEQLRVGTLLFFVRTVARHRLGRPRLRLRATAVTHQVDAPRLWVPVRGRAPIYLDLMAHIPDRAAFEACFPLSPAVGAMLPTAARAADHPPPDDVAGRR